MIGIMLLAALVAPVVIASMAYKGRGRRPLYVAALVIVLAVAGTCNTFIPSRFDIERAPPTAQAGMQVMFDVLPGIIVVLLAIAFGCLLAVILYRPRAAFVSKAAEGQPIKKCPFCAEVIQDAAIVCRYCGRDLPQPAAAPAGPVDKPSPPAPAAVSWSPRTRAIAVLLGVAVLVVFIVWRSDSSPPPTAPPPVTITKATFEPVYRASKAIQGATASGVTHVKFGELMQSFSTEIGIAKDKPMNHLDKALMTLYEDAFAAYQFSGVLWQAKIRSSEEDYKGEILVGASGQLGSDVAPGIAKYGLVPIDRKLYGTKYQFLPASSVQAVWNHADEALTKATEVYYGRQTPTK